MDQPKEEEQEEGKSLETLSEDCVFEVLDRLPKNYLYPVAETCTRLLDLASIQYRRLCPGKYTCLSMVDDKVVLLPNEHDVQMFGRKFLNLIICSGGRNVRLDDKLLQFVLLNCSTSLQMLRFEEVMLQKVQLEAMKHMIHRVNTLVLHKCGMNDEFYDCLLRHCYNLEHLIISDTYTSNCTRSDGNDWLLKKYPALQSVQLCSITMVSFEHAYWEMFFRQNPQIKRFSCDHWYSTDPSDRPIKTIRKNARNLTHLYISLCGIGHLNYTYSDLAGLCQEEKFQGLELQFAGVYGLQYLNRHLKLLCTMKKLQAIHLTDMVITKEAATDIASFANLKQLNFINTAFDHEFAEAVSKKLPDLEEIYSNVITNDFTPFIRNTPTLKKIMLPKSAMGELNLGWGILWLNEERLKCENASPITIYVRNIATGDAEVEVFSSGIITIQTVPNGKRIISQVENTFINI